MNLREAAATILGSMPPGMQVRFYWAEGVARVDLTRLDGVVETFRLVRGGQGTAIVEAATVH